MGVADNVRMQNSWHGVQFSRIAEDEQESRGSLTATILRAGQAPTQTTEPAPWPPPGSLNRPFYKEVVGDCFGIWYSARRLSKTAQKRVWLIAYSMDKKRTFLRIACAISYTPYALFVGEIECGLRRPG
jgi:hypothetical protein